MQFLRELVPFLGSSPNSGQSPVEWGEIPFVCPSIPPLAGPQTLLAGPQTPQTGPQILLACPHTPTAGPQTLPACPQNPFQLALCPLWTDGWMGKWTNGWINGISLHYTGLCHLLGPLPCYCLTLHNIKVAGEGSCQPYDALMHLGDWFLYILTL